jgi:di/tricarboxylate transporter
MDTALLSLVALGAAILASCVTRLNVGLIALALAWLVGVYAGGMPAREVIAGFPAELFVTLAGVTLLFTQAQVNGTLGKIAHLAVRGCRGNAGLIPVMFFLLAVGLASLGPGNIATAALLAPMAMAAAGRARIPAFLMAIMVGNGANAGSLSPFAPTGVIVNGIMARIGLGGFELETYRNNLIAHALVAFGGYLLFGGWRLFSRKQSADRPETGEPVEPFDTRNWITVGIIAALVGGVLFGGVHVGLAAIAGAVLLALLGMAEQAAAIRAMPWNVMLMVCGVTVLIELMVKTQGLDLFTDLLARFATGETITGFVAFVTGIISVYSSTSGVVLPAFLPTVPGLVERLGGGDPLAIASAMNVGSHLVDVSPLSTIGALCIASAAPTEDARMLFHKLLAWGLSMSVVGAFACYLIFGLWGL